MTCVSVWEVESECLLLVILCGCVGMRDLLLAPCNTICMLVNGTGTHYSVSLCVRSGD